LRSAVVACLFAGLSVLSLLSFAEEKILSYRSDITVYSDGGMEVKETIKVTCRLENIKHGIYRDFPTEYKDLLGHSYKVKFEIVSVTRDGQAENYWFSFMPNGKRIYIGNSDVTLKPGVYVYAITYRTERQLGFFKGYDELYWNVTGNGWEFEIVNASAYVTLPQDAGEKVIGTDAYTGAMGEKGKDFEVTKDVIGNVVFNTKRPLRPGEGFTIAVSWPPGYVKRPDAFEKLKYFLQDNIGLFLGGIGAVIVFLYYIFVWASFGRDPAKGIIIPLYEPPGRLSAAAVRYVLKMGYDDNVFAALIISLAVKKYITIKKENNEYSITRTGDPGGSLTADEAAAAKVIFRGRDTFKFTAVNHAVINKAKKNLQASLKIAYEKTYFITNRKYFITGLLVSAAVVILSAFVISGENTPIVIFISFWLTIWTVAVVMLVRQVITSWKLVFSGGTRNLANTISLTFFAAPFIFAEIFVGGMLMKMTGAGGIALIILIASMNCAFFFLLKAPTLAGRRVMDMIEGLKMYLSVAEKDRLNMLNTPEVTPQLFEKFLPYAFALDVDQKWCERFAETLRKAEEAGTYHNEWYVTSSIYSLNMLNLSSLGSSLVNSISSSSVPPGSHSGSGGGSLGGGSSGGGGGGGGGGGW